MDYFEQLCAVNPSAGEFEDILSSACVEVGLSDSKYQALCVAIQDSIKNHLETY